jgi:hypothetical protein
MSNPDTHDQSDDLDLDAETVRDLELDDADVRGGAIASGRMVCDGGGGVTATGCGS